MSREEFLNSLTKQDILLGISRYLCEYAEEIPEEVSPEDIWNTIMDLIFFDVI